MVTTLQIFCQYQWTKGILFEDFDASVYEERRGWIKLTFHFSPVWPQMSSLRPSSCWCLHCHSIKLLPHVTPLLTAAGPNIRHGDGSSAGGTQQYTDGSQLPDCFFMTNILPGSHRAEYIISLQAYLCMDGKFLFEHQSSYQLFLTRKYCSFSRIFCSGKGIKLFSHNWC